MRGRLPLGILAGGNGTRLFGQKGGCKALVRVAGRPLIDFILEEARLNRVDELCVVLRPCDHELACYLRANPAFSTVIVLRSESEGTMNAVCQINAVLGSTNHLMSTCDVVSQPGIVAALLTGVMSVLRKGVDPLVVFLAAGYLKDNMPIWIDADSEGVVHRYGKDIDCTGTVFAHVRWCSSALGSAISELDDPSIRTDTQLMSALVRKYPGRMIAVRSDLPVWDVDDLNDVHAAEEALGWSVKACQ